MMVFAIYIDLLTHSGLYRHRDILYNILSCSSWSLPFVLYKKLGLLYSLCTIVCNSTFPDECIVNN